MEPSLTEKPKTRFVRPYARGQITIPLEFRERLEIDENTLLQISLKGSKIEITPFKVVDSDQMLREYDAAEIEEFLKEDKIDPQTAAKARKLLGG